MGRDVSSGTLVRKGGRSVVRLRVPAVIRCLGILNSQSHDRNGVDQRPGKDSRIFGGQDRVGHPQQHERFTGLAIPLEAGIGRQMGDHALVDRVAGAGHVGQPIEIHVVLTHQRREAGSALAVVGRIKNNRRADETNDHRRLGNDVGFHVALDRCIDNATSDVEVEVAF